jgi:hypothetical protein
MTTSYVDRRELRTLIVVAVFVAAIVALVWNWNSTQTSSAAFADREVFDRNHLGAGTVDIALGDDTVGFTALDMAAGDVATGQLELLNSGTFALRYTLSASTDDGVLGDVLELRAWLGSSGCGESPPVEAQVWLPLVDGAPIASDARGPTAGQLTPGASDVLCLAAGLPLSLPNSMQGKGLDLTLSVHASHDIGGES